MLYPLTYIFTIYLGKLYIYELIVVLIENFWLHVRA